MTAKLFKAPTETPKFGGDLGSIFFAGSIEMGKAEDWQSRLFEHIHKFDVHVYNPRRDNWDSSWKQDISNPNFNEQVTWELKHIENADMVVFYFDPDTKSPITLLELGLQLEAHDPQTLFVCCPDGYWRKGNVQIVCARYGVKLYNTYDEMSEALYNYLDGDDD